MCSFTSVQSKGPVFRTSQGQKVNFEVKTDKMRGKVSAENLSLA